MVMTTRKTTKKIIIGLILLLTPKITMNNEITIIHNVDYNKTISVAYMAQKQKELYEEEKKTSIKSFSGDLTGYGANCKLCSGRLGCNGQNVKDGTTTYKDKEYGTVRIVASSKKIKCGSIVKFNYKSKETYAIVLDRGVLGYDLDLLVESESYASKYVGRKKITYDLLRDGW